MGDENSRSCNETSFNGRAAFKGKSITPLLIIYSTKYILYLFFGKKLKLFIDYWAYSKVRPHCRRLFKFLMSTQNEECPATYKKDEARVSVCPLKGNLPL
jgi:hypothetical protein